LAEELFVAKQGAKKAMGLVVIKEQLIATMTKEAARFGASLEDKERMCLEAETARLKARAEVDEVLKQLKGSEVRGASLLSKLKEATVEREAIEKELQEKVDAVRKLKTDEVSSGERVKQKEAQLKHLTNSNSDVVTSLEQSLESAKSELKMKDLDLEVAKSNASAMGEKIRELEVATRDLQSRKLQLEVELEDKIRSCQVVQAGSSGASEQLVTTQEDLRRLKTSYSDILQLLEAKEKQCRKLVASSADLSFALSEAETQLDTSQVIADEKSEHNTQLELTRSDLFARISELEQRLAGVIKSRSEIVAKLAREGEIIMQLKGDKVGVERQLQEIKTKHEKLVVQIRNSANNSDSEEGEGGFCNSCVLKEDELYTMEQETKQLHARIDQSTTELRSLSESRATLMDSIAAKDLLLKEGLRMKGEGSDERLNESQRLLQEAHLALRKAERQLEEQTEHCRGLEQAVVALKVNLARSEKEGGEIMLMGAEQNDPDSQQNKVVLDLYEREQYLAADEEAVSNEQRKLEDREAQLTKWQGDLQSKSDEVKASTVDLQQKIQHYNERVRTLNTSTKEFKKIRKESLSSNTAALVSVAQEESVIADLTEKLAEKEAELATYGSLEVQKEAVVKAEKELLHGKDELAKKVNVYNERVRVLNKATKELKQKRKDLLLQSPQSP
jgi:chromosome segregation ATPase